MPPSVERLKYSPGGEALWERHYDSPGGNNQPNDIGIDASGDIYIAGASWVTAQQDFDMLLLKHAEAKGCRILQGVSVDEFVFDSDGKAEGVRVRVAGQELVLEAKVVVDAAGRATKLGRQLDLEHEHNAGPSPDFRVRRTPG